MFVTKFIPTYNWNKMWINRVCLFHFDLTYLLQIVFLSIMKESQQIVYSVNTLRNVNDCVNVPLPIGIVQHDIFNCSMVW